LVDWIFAFETRRIVSRSKIDNVVNDIVKLLEYAKGFPRRTLEAAGQLLLNRHITHKSGHNPQRQITRPDFGSLPDEME